MSPVTRRLLEIEGVNEVLQLGVRSLSSEEVEFLRGEPRVTTWFVEDFHSGDWIEELSRRLLGKSVYTTIDVDCLDPSLMPATGTPEPDGLKFHHLERILRVVAQDSRPVAFDCVELAPIKGQHAPNFIAAKLVYRTMTLLLAKTIANLL